MINQDGLWSGDRVQVRSFVNRDEAEFEVTLGHTYLAKFFDKDWANAFAEVIESLVEPGDGHQTAVRRVHDGLLTLASMRDLLAGILERAADLHVAQSLEAMEDRERDHHRVVAETLRREARDRL